MRMNTNFQQDSDATHIHVPIEVHSVPWGYESEHH